MDDILQRIGETEGPTGLFLLGAVSAVEYLFPPFPGDVALLAAAILVAARGWSLAPVLAASTAGSVVGASGHWWLGRVLARRNWAPKGKRGQAVLAGVRAIAARFERHGAAYLVVNRFVPGLRSFFFLAAGWSGMSLARAVLWGAISAALWNLLLVGAAFWVGPRLDSLQSLVRGWSIAVWIAIALAIAVWWIRRRSRT